MIAPAQHWSALKKARAALLVFGILSLGLIITLDDVPYYWLRYYDSPLLVIPQLRLTSLFVVTLIFIFVRRNFPPAEENNRPPPRRAAMVAGLWLLGTAYFVHVQKIWVPELPTWIDITSGMLTGLIAEELLFRGALYDLSLMAGVSALAVTSVLFGLQHLAYHHFALTPESITQVLYTVPMGFIFGYTRKATGRVWPVILLHMANNAISLFKNF